MWRRASARPPHRNNPSSITNPSLVLRFRKGRDDTEVSSFPGFGLQRRLHGFGIVGLVAIQRAIQLVRARESVVVGFVDGRSTSRQFRLAERIVHFLHEGIRDLLPCGGNWGRLASRIGLKKGGGKRNSGIQLQFVGLSTGGRCRAVR